MGDNLINDELPDSAPIVSSKASVMKQWEDLLSLHTPEFIWLRFMAPCGMVCAMMFPTKRFSHLIANKERVSITIAALHAMRHGHIAEGNSTSGLLHLEPDLGSAYMFPGPGARRLEIMASFVEKDGTPHPGCARGMLGEFTEKLGKQYGLDVMFGFEIEVVFMKPTGGKDVQVPMFEEPSTNGTWGTVTPDDMVLLPVVEDIVRALEKVDVDVHKFHAEAAPGQWEFVLPPKSPVEAVDMLVRARETIAVIAEQHSLRATLHPRPWADQAGTGAHVHISATPVGYSDSEKSESFFAGIMAHLPSISPFLLPLDDSYQRVISGIWSGGEHVCWGWDNKEAPLRRVTEDRFELKMVCGTANPYVAMSALLASGLDGVEKRLPLVGGDCQKPAAEFTEEERQELKMTKLPNNLDDALQLLQEDKAVVDLLGVSFVSAYIVITKEWNQHLREMSTEEKRNYLLSTY